MHNFQLFSCTKLNCSRHSPLHSLAVPLPHPMCQIRDCKNVFGLTNREQAFMLLGSKVPKRAHEIRFFPQARQEELG